jgi:hypothetical protein
MKSNFYVCPVNIAIALLNGIIVLVEVLRFVLSLLKTKTSGLGM